MADSPLLTKIDAFLARTGLSATAFGKAAVGDPNFVRELRGGREPRLRLVAKAEEFMTGYIADRRVAELAEVRP